MSNFITYANQLRQYVPNLSPQQAEDFINVSWRNICDANDEWSFLLREGYWLSPAVITLSGLTVTQNSANILLDHIHLQQLANQTNPALTLRQVRVGTSGGPLYGIASTDVQWTADASIVQGSAVLTSTSGAFGPELVGKKIRVSGAGPNGDPLNTTVTNIVNGAVTLATPASTTVSAATVYWGSVLTLDRLYRESSSPIAMASILRAYYKPEDTSFRRLSHIVDPIYGYWWGGLVQHVSQLNRQDPRRSSQGQPYQLYFSHFDPTDQLPVYEMWPAPTMERAFSYWYWRNCPVFTTDTDTLPPIIPTELLMMGARIFAYEWAATQDPDPRSRQSYFAALSNLRSRYSTEGQRGRPLGLLEQVKRNDRNTYAKEFLRQPRGRMVGWPIDSNFLQSHAIPPWYG